MNSNQLANELLIKVKVNDDVKNDLNVLKNLSLEQLYKDLSSENHQKAFWINIYNAFLQIIVGENPLLFDNRKTLFTRKNIVIAQQSLSLDDIEHGILRCSSWKYGGGYLSKIIITKFEKQFRVKKVDPRIHFALNCGAKSCPPIHFYQVETLDVQLNIATEAYLETEVNYDLKDKTLNLSSLFFWYKGDFGGKKGIILFLQKYGYPIYTDIHLKYTPYDWHLTLSNYKT